MRGVQLGRLGLGALAVLCSLTLLAGCGGTYRTSRPHYKVGTPYQVSGQWYHPRMVSQYEQEGVASWYGTDFHGRPTANGEVYNMYDLTAAHPTLPLPSLVRVTNLENGRSAVVRVNDRGPFVKNRIIDLSKQAARALDFERKGTARVRVTYMGLAELYAGQPQPATLSYAALR